MIQFHNNKFDLISHNKSFFNGMNKKLKHFIIKLMENGYNDELLPENFEQIAKAYSNSLRNKGFVFVSLEEEEFNLLVCEVFIILAKMEACLARLRHQIDAKVLQEKIDNSTCMLRKEFQYKKTHKFVCIEDENNAFLSLISLENLLIIKLMLLSIKSEKLEVCNKIITSISCVFAESFSCEGFKLNDT